MFLLNQVGTLLLFAGIGCAADFGLITVLGPGVASTPAAAEAAVIAAGHTPNATNALEFAAFNGQSSSGSTGGYMNGTWTFRVNVTDFAVPNTVYDLGMAGANYSLNHRIVNTQWQLDWPTTSSSSNQSFAALLQPAGLKAVFSAYTVPAQNYGSFSNQSGGCASVLGDSCTQALQQAALSEHTAAGIQGIDYPSGCPNANQGVSFTITANGTNSFYPNDTLVALTSQPFTAVTSAQQTAYDDAVTGVNLLIVSFAYADSSDASGRTGGTPPPVVVCNVVDKQQAVPSAAAGLRSAAPSAEVLVLLGLAAAAFVL